MAKSECSVEMEGRARSSRGKAQSSPQSGQMAGSKPGPRPEQMAVRKAEAGEEMRSELDEEIARLKTEFAGADEGKLRAMAALIEQAACERIYLRQLNRQAMATGLVKVHPDNPTLQRALPVSGEISRHAASLTNITDKLMKHLAAEENEDDEGLGDYE